MDKTHRRVQSPAVFVGKEMYPQITVGLLTTFKDQHHDDPLHWHSHKYNRQQITKLRHELTHSAKRMPSVTTKNPFIQTAQDITLAKKTVDCDIELTNISQWQTMQSLGEAIPFGGRAVLEKIDTENVKSNIHLQKAFDDTDNTATNALKELYAKQIDEHTLTRMLSVANLGVETRRKLVPTRWAITAVDDTLSKHMVSDIITNDFGPCKASFCEYLGNYFLILQIEHSFMFEFIEIMPDKTTIKSDYELCHGRQQYAYNTTGGYYAARLPIIEKLKQENSQCATIVIRYISPEYSSSLGVWVIRQTVREAIGKNIEFSDKNLLLTFAEKYIQRKWNINPSAVFEKSQILPLISKQSTLHQFFT